MFSVTLVENLCANSYAFLMIEFCSSVNFRRIQRDDITRDFRAQLFLHVRDRIDSSFDPTYFMQKSQILSSILYYSLVKHE